MKRLTHIALATLLVSFSAVACNDDPLLDLDTVPPTANAGEDQTVTDADDSGSELVQLDGSASTAGSFPITGYTWTEGSTVLTGATVDGGRTVTVDLDVGVHNITLTVEDEAGRTGTDGVVVTVEAPAVNQPPTATITAPADLSEFFDTETITFTGTGTDAEDGNLTGGALDWTSDVDGQFGEGETLEVDASTLTLGAHTITLIANDTEGATGEASIGITIVEATSTISFATDVQTYFVDSGCTGCHAAGGIAASIPLDSYDAIVTGVNGDGDPLIVIGDAAAASAVLIPQLLAAHGDGPDDEGFVNDVLTGWINDGAPNN